MAPQAKADCKYLRDVRNRAIAARDDFEAQMQDLIDQGADAESLKRRLKALNDQIARAQIQLYDCEHPVAPKPPEPPKQPEPRCAFPMNLDWDGLDNNGIPLNPDWCYHKDDPWTKFGIKPSPPNVAYLCGNPEGNSYCTDQKTYTDRAWACETFTSDYWYIPGHWNWNTGATYEGYVCWVEKSTNGTDDDYNINLLTPNGAGLTTGNTSGYLLMEFDSEETIDNFASKWWKSFKSAVDDDDHPKRPHAMIDGRFAIASGLLGLDTAHPSVGAELHPVWALAIQTDLTRDAERWPMFVRNWGNEGYCSRAQHYLGLEDYTFKLPWRPGATGVNVTGTDFYGNNDKISIFISAQYGEAVFVRFLLPQPREKGIVEGSMDLHWDGEPRLEIGPPCGKRARAKPQNFVGKLIEQMTPGQRKIYFNNLPKRQDAYVAKPCRVAILDNLEWPRRWEQPRIWSETDRDKVARDYQRINALVTAFDGDIPGLSSKRRVERRPGRHWWRRA